VNFDNAAQGRLPALQRCLDALRHAIAARAPGPAIEACSAGVFNALAQTAPRDDAPGHRLNP
jgi:hypothetical protein